MLHLRLGPTTRLVQTHFTQRRGVSASTNPTSPTIISSGRRWSAEEDFKILELYAKKYDPQAIADALPGRTRQAVIVRHSRVCATVMGGSIHIGAPQMPKNQGPWNEQDLAIALEMHKAGHYVKAISQRLGRKWHSVAERVQGIAIRPETSAKQRKNKRWSEIDDDHLIELRASGLKPEAIASALGRTMFSVDCRWQRIPQWRKDDRSGPRDPEDISAKSSQEQLQQTSGKASQRDAQSRRSFTTAHGWNPRSGIDTQEHLVPFSYGSRQLVSVRSWKRRGIFSLPYRPQQRLNHTGELPTSGSTKRAPYQTRKTRPYSMESYRQIIDLRAADYPWANIAHVLCRSESAVRLQGLSLLKEEQWLQRFEETRLTLPEDQRHKPPRNIPFSAKEDAVVADMRKAGSTYSAIAQALNRHPKSIESRWKDNFETHNPLAKLNQATKYQKRPEVRKRLTSEEKEQLRQMAAQGTTIYHMAQVLGRPIKSVYGHLRTWGLHDLWIKSRAHGQHPWSESDDQILRSAIESGKNGIELWQLIPERNPLDIWKRAQVLGINDTGIQKSEFYWRAAQDSELLRLRAEGKRYTEISGIIGKSAWSCRSRWVKLVSKPISEPNKNRWTAADDAHLLRLSADGIGHDEIAATLGRPSGTSCKNRLNRLNVGNNRWHLKWTAKEDSELQRLSADGKTDDQISTILSRTAASCYQRRRNLRVRDDLTRQE
jgi:hypothetical protein